uniref:serine/threonine-protein kinase Nek6-like n=1 Tax=Styela clava TaxID=7725 RepID=UPI00193AAEE5|nr:serine/threonine-protein kinase Nek6-like [Styela clava]XP_039248399.1 serine/threonine-protein kinase Nek6-like [Styela clava]
MTTDLDEKVVKETDKYTDDKDEDQVKLSDSIYFYRSKKMSNNGEVYEGTMHSKTYGTRTIAVKLVQYSKQNLEEASILLSLNPHTHVVSIIDADVYQGQFKYMYIAMDKCHSDNLRRFVENRRKNEIPFNAELMIDFTKQLFTGIHYIHDKLVIHKDLKPDNVFLSLDQKVLKIGDFGLSERVDSRTRTIRSSKGLGTDGYRAPESFVSGFPTSQITDIYSLAVLIYYLWSNGRHPFGNEKDLWNHFMKNNLNMNLDRILLPYADIAKDLLIWMLQFVPRNRPIIDQVLSHKYMVPNNVKGLLFREVQEISESLESTEQSLLNLPHFKNETFHVGINATEKGNIQVSSNSSSRLSNLILVAKMLQEHQKIKMASRQSMDRTLLHDDIYIFWDKKLSHDPFTDIEVFEGRTNEESSSSKPLAIKVLRGFDKLVLGAGRTIVEAAKSIQSLPLHPNIVSIISVGDIRNQSGLNASYVAMERCHSGTLEDYVLERKRNNVCFDFKLALEHSIQLVSGVYHLHTHGIIHGRLHARNILLSLDMQALKISAFAFGRQKLYINNSSGEVFDHGVISFQSDVFSLGVLLYYIWSNGCDPLTHDDNRQFENYKNLNLMDLQIPNSKIAQHLLTKMLEKRPSQRPTIKEIVDHSYWNSIS